MSEVHDPEGDSLDALGQVVDGFGLSVADMRRMPRRDLVGPLADRAAETLHLDRHLLIGEVAAECR